MGKLLDSKIKTLGNLAAVQTLLERFPVLVTTNSFKSINFNVNSLEFMMDILRVIGVDNKALLEWAANLLTGDDDTEGGVLSKIEDAIKLILKLNFKNYLSCSINPIISDDLLDEHIPIDINGNVIGPPTQGPGIAIDIGAIDFFGMFKNSPLSDVGKYYYFDIDNYNINELWMSKDFNAFLWYTINKGIYQDPVDKCKMKWDNRNDIKSNTWDFTKSGYLEAGLPTKQDIPSYNETHSPTKKQIIQGRFSEKNLPFNNQLIIQLISDTYYKTDKIISSVVGRKVPLNKTIFEFNNDFINSLKLFDSKVLVSQIIDRLTGCLALSVNYSINELVVQGKIGNIVKKIIQGDDTEINDCFYTFSNDEYDSLIQEAELKYAGLLKYSGDVESGIAINPEEILKSLTGITENSTLQEKTTIIANTFNEISGIASQDGSISSTDKFGFGQNIIYSLVEQIATALVGTILSPKVMIIFAINAHIAGDEYPKSLDDVMKRFSNLISNIIIQIKDIILKELYIFLIDQLKPLIELFAVKLSLETIKKYKDMLRALLDACNFSSNYSIDSVIDNVDFANIVPVKITPEDSIC